MHVTAISLCSHFGSHIDAPSHYVKAGTPVDALPAGLLIGSCRVVYCDGNSRVPAGYVESMPLRNVRRLLIENCSSKLLGDNEFHGGHAALHLDAAKVLVAGGVSLLGVDETLIPPCAPSQSIPVHCTFLGPGPIQTAIEELDLPDVEPGEYNLVATPLRLTGPEAGPTRVLLGQD